MTPGPFSSAHSAFLSPLLNLPGALTQAHGLNTISKLIADAQIDVCSTNLCPELRTRMCTCLLGISIQRSHRRCRFNSAKPSSESLPHPCSSPSLLHFRKTSPLLLKSSEPSSTPPFLPCLSRSGSLSCRRLARCILRPRLELGCPGHHPLQAATVSPYTPTWGPLGAQQQGWGCGARARETGKGKSHPRASSPVTSAAGATKDSSLGRLFTDPSPLTDGCLLRPEPPSPSFSQAVPCKLRSSSRGKAESTRLEGLVLSTSAAAGTSNGLWEGACGAGSSHRRSHGRPPTCPPTQGHQGDLAQM